MSAKNKDKKNRWRNKTVAFRVSPKEDEQIEIAVRLSGLTKQDYIIIIPEPHRRGYVFSLVIGKANQWMLTSVFQGALQRE